MKRKVYAISLEEAQREYRDNDVFRDMLDSGCFVYTANSYVINLPEYVSGNEDSAYDLTDYARAHIDECALAFEETEIIKYSGNEIRGSQPRTDTHTIEKKRVTKYVSHLQGTELNEKILKMRRASKLLFEESVKEQMTCWEYIFDMLNVMGITKSMFCNRTSLDAKVYDRAKQNKASMPEIKTIVTIAAAYGLDYLETENLLTLAGHRLSPVSPEHDCYRFILTAMRACSMQAKNELLIKEGFEPLGSKPHKKNDV